MSVCQVYRLYNRSNIQYIFFNCVALVQCYKYKFIQNFQISDYK